MSGVVLGLHHKFKNVTFFEQFIKEKVNLLQLMLSCTHDLKHLILCFSVG